MDSSDAGGPLRRAAVCHRGLRDAAALSNFENLPSRPVERAVKSSEGYLDLAAVDAAAEELAGAFLLALLVL